MFSKKTTKIDQIFTVELTKCQIDCDEFFNFCGLLRKHELYGHFLARYGLKSSIVANKTKEYIVQDREVTSFKYSKSKKKDDFFVMS